MIRTVMLLVMVFIVVGLFLSSNNGITGNAVSEVNSPIFSGVVVSMIFLMLTVTLFKILKVWVILLIVWFQHKNLGCSQLSQLLAVKMLTQFF